MDEIEYPPAKRARRSTKRCHECVRRKVKCQLATQDVAICSECIKTGAQCTLQSASTEKLENASLTSQSNQEERLKRIEQMLHNLVEAQRNQYTPTLPETELNLQPAVNWTDIINADMFSGMGVQSIEFDPFTLPENFKRIDMNVDIKGKSAKEILLNLLPTQDEIIRILDHTGAWALELPTPPGPIRGLKDSTRVEVRNIDTAPRLSTMNIAKTLLFLALCLQQLPLGLDVSQLNIDDTEDLFKQYIHSVTSLALADEENICTIEGLECLLLLATIHMNAGALKKAWLNFRRALDAARLMGFNSSFGSSTQTSESFDLPVRRRLWLSIIMGHTFCSLLLGLDIEPSNDSFSSDFAWEDRSVDAELNFQRRMCIVSFQLSQRNARGLQHSLDDARKINMLIEKLEDSMPQSWWQRPKMSRERNIDCANEYERLLCHLCFFQIRILVNVPFLFEPDDEAQKCRNHCLEAARTTVYRYLALRLSGNTQAHCRVAEIVVFLASLVLILGYCRHSSSDIALVEQVIDSASSLGESFKRSAEILTGLLKRCMETNSQKDCSKEDILTLTSPHPTSEILTTSWHEDMMASLQRTLEQYTESRILDPIL